MKNLKEVIQEIAGMKTLLEDYKRRLKTVMNEIENGGGEVKINRLNIKASCYRTFIAELERELVSVPIYTVKNLKEVIQETAGLNPVQFEAYCEVNGIQTEWLEVCVTDFNEGFYSVTLPDYSDENVFANNGFAITFSSTITNETY